MDGDHRAEPHGGLLDDQHTFVAKLAGEIVTARVAAPGQPEDLASLMDENTSCIVVQNPDVFGALRDLKPLADRAHV